VVASEHALEGHWKAQDAGGVVEASAAPASSPASPSEASRGGLAASPPSLAPPVSLRVLPSAPLSRFCTVSPEPPPHATITSARQGKASAVERTQNLIMRRVTGPSRHDALAARPPSPYPETVNAPLARLGLSVATLLAAISLAPRAEAQNGALAEALFQDGHKLLKAGKIHEACEKFAESQRLDPALGTFLSLAACHEKEGRNATAWTEFTDARQQATRMNDAARAEYARVHIDSIEKLLHRVVIEVLSRPEGIEVKLDRQTLGSAAWGTAIPLDPGEHVIDVTAPGRRPWQRCVVAGPGAGTDRIEVPNLDDVNASPPPPPPPPPPPDRTSSTITASPPPPPVPTGDTTPSTPSSWNSKKTIGVVVAGVGLVGVGVAIGTGLHAMSLASDRDALCAPGTVCYNQQAFNLNHDAQVNQLVAVISGVVGAVAIGAGGVLFFTAGSGQPKPATGRVQLTPMIGAGTAGLRLGGAF